MNENDIINHLEEGAEGDKGAKEKSKANVAAA